MLLFTFSKYSYPLRLDDNVVRSVASFTFFISVIMALNTELRYLVLILFVDFILRYIHPSISPIAQLNKYISQKLLNNPIIPKYAPPKRFAVLIGLTITGIMSIAFFADFEVLFLVLLGFLLFASGLQSWFDYCLGCKVYDILIKLKFVQRGHHHSDLLNYLSDLNSSNSDNNRPLQSFEIIQSELKSLSVLLNQGVSEVEGVLINQLVRDIKSYAQLLEMAIGDGIITSYEESELLLEGRNILNQVSTMTLTGNSFVKNNLLLAQDYISFLTRKIKQSYVNGNGHNTNSL